MTNHHKLSSFKLIVSGFWRSGFEMGLTAPKSVCRQGHISSEALGKDSFALRFQLLEAASIPWLLAYPSIINASSTVSSNLSPTLSLYFCKNISSLTPLPPSSKGLCDYVCSPRLSRIISRLQISN